MKGGKAPILYKYNNESKSLLEWSNIYNIPKYMIYYRLREGWDMEKALNTPVTRTTKKYTYQDKTTTLSGWASIIDMNVKTMQSYIKNGWTISQIVESAKCPISITMNGKTINTNLLDMSKVVMLTPMNLKGRLDDYIEYL